MKKKDNKLYEVDRDVFELEMQRLVTTALIADITAAVMLITSIVILAFTIFFSGKTEPVVVEFREPEIVVEETKETEEPEPDLPEPEPVVEPEPEATVPPVQEPELVVYPATDAEIELLALVTMAEAEGEPEEGKRLVIDTVLNRVDAVGRWPNTISEVIYQPGQFVAMSNGRAERCHVTEEVRQLVREELLSRTDTEVVYFTAGGYGRYGTPVFQVGNHYFCK